MNAAPETSPAERERWNRLADRQEIADVLSAYAHGVDRNDGALVLSCFHADAVFRFGDGPAAPVAEFFAASAPQAAGLRATSHNLSNHMVSFDGDRADSQINLTAYHLVGADAPDRPPLFPAAGNEYGVLIGGRYVDLLERRDAGWRILRRHLIFDWSFNVDGPAIPHAMIAPREDGFAAKFDWLRR